MKPSTEIGAVVLAAGQSTRFRSARPKLVHELAGRPLIDWPLQALRALGAEPIVVVVGHEAASVEAACGRGVVFALQEERRGTGHAVLAAEAALRDFDGDLLVLNGDLPLLGAATLRRLVKTHRDSGGTLTLLTSIVDDPHGWGRVLRAAGAVERIVEERDATSQIRAMREVNVGVYCAKPSVLFPLLHRVTPDNAQGEIYLTDVVERAAQAGVRVGAVVADPIEVGQVNTRGELAAMEKTLRKQINARWMNEGVTLEDPDTTYIGPDVRVGPDTVIGPNVQLRGKTSLGRGCRLDGSAFLTDAAIGDGVHLRFGVVVTEAVIGSGCQIGPFAHLRPGTRLGEQVHIGDFVETKNAVLGKRTKANHLAYLGDAEIGADANIGAGTITCNYDGFRKHRTVIGDRVQVGSDSQLVAPVRLGDDVYVASGTTVRRDVAPGALVFNPRDQKERSGWVAGFRILQQRAANDSAKPKPKKKPSGSRAPARPAAATHRKQASKPAARKRRARP